MLSEQSLAPSLNGAYKFLDGKNNCSLFIDRINFIVKITWVGEVDKDTASFLLTRAADEIEKGNANKILLNRKNLKQFSKEASKWIKDDLLRGRAKKLVHQVEKVATVKSSTAIGDLFATLVSSSIKIVFPKLSMDRFNTESEAKMWLLT